MKPSLTFSVLALILTAAVCRGQGSPQPRASNSDASVADTRSQLTALRDAFVKKTSASGLSCSIEPPKIIVRDVPSFGAYDPDTNTLTSPAWEQMSSEEQALFYRAQPPDAPEADARAEFELGVHHWVLVHELGHWWETCRGMVDRGDHYAFELEANKIAAAYWNERDPSVNAHQQAVFEAITQKWKNPVPAGQAPRIYFNANYERLAPTPAYIWFQAQMCLTALRQKPMPSFSTALAQVPRNG